MKGKEKRGFAYSLFLVWKVKDSCIVIGATSINSSLQRVGIRMLRIQKCRALNYTDWWDQEIRDVNTTWVCLGFFVFLLLLLFFWQDRERIHYWHLLQMLPSPQVPEGTFHQIPQLWNLTLPFIWNLRLMPSLSPPGILSRSRKSLLTSRKKLLLNLHICCLYSFPLSRTRIHIYSRPADRWRSHQLVEFTKQRNDPRSPKELTLQPLRSE